jgi:tRNA (cytidine/uridine-2'-O-)-methyltransferase
MFNVVLIEPEIPPNTGNIGRLCLGASARLHLVEPLGFAMDDKTLLRAGLDYWKEVDCHRWPSFDALKAASNQEARYFYFTTKTSRRYWDVKFQDGDYLVFGRESRGLPASLLEANEAHCVTIPQIGTRSLNLATSVGIGLYEAWRQISI